MSDFNQPSALKAVPTMNGSGTGKRLTTQVVDCARCCGSGRGITAAWGCCNQPTPMGECCNNPIEVYDCDQCSDCNGLGWYKKEGA